MWEETEGLSNDPYNYTDQYDTNDYAVDNESSDLKKLLIGALAGAVAGTLIGSLYTEPGTRARRRVSDTSRELASKVKQKASDLNEGIKDKASNITEKIGEKVDATKEKLTKVFRKENPNRSYAYGDSAYFTDDDYDRISKTKVLLALLAASAAGTIVWSLTTEKGRETRRQVGSSSKKIVENVKAKVPGIVETVKKVYEEAKEGAKEMVEKQKSPDTQGGTTYNNPTI